MCGFKPFDPLFVCSSQVQEGLDRALRLQKQSKKRDYYKILGLKR